MLYVATVGGIVPNQFGASVRSNVSLSVTAGPLNVKSASGQIVRRVLDEKVQRRARLRIPDRYFLELADGWQP